MNRREFLQSSAAALAGAAIANPAQADNDFGPFTIAVQSYCFRNFDREQALKRTQALGVKFIEFYQKHAPLDSNRDQIKAIKRMCSDYGITPIAFGVQHFSKNHDANHRIFHFGQELGVKHFSADPDADSFESLDKLCEGHKISIAIHPHGPVGGGKLHRWYSAEVILAAVKDHHPLIGTCLDTGHLIRSDQLGKKLDPAQQVRLMGARNFGMHLKDHDNERKTDVVYGKGVLDVPSVLSALKAVQFNEKPHKGYISIEYEANPDNPSPDMAACLEVLRAAIKALS